MSVTCGFFNSLNGDRKYDAYQMSSIFDGLIIDGIFASIGTAFAVKAAGGLTVNVGTGKAWFNHTWTVNDAILPLTASAADVAYDRIDAVVLEINATESVRENTIKFVTGEPSDTPVRPTLINEDEIHQYPLCYISRKGGTKNINQADITSMVGTETTPFVVGILKTIDLNDLLGQWQNELDLFVEEQEKDIATQMASERLKLNQFITNERNNVSALIEDERNSFDTLVADEKKDFNALITDEKNSFTTLFAQIKSDLQAEQETLNQWVTSEQDDFLAWYEEMKGQLSGDVAGNLQLAIDKESIKRILLTGLEDGVKEFSDDGTVIKTTASDGRTLTKTFTNSFLTMTTVLKSAAGAELAKAVKTFESDGKLVTTVVTYS